MKAKTIENRQMFRRYIDIRINYFSILKWLQI
jgi:hypothetical protein